MIRPNTAWYPLVITTKLAMSGLEPKWSLARKFYADFNATASGLI